MVKSAYIHIPFCKQKCYYCSFVSFPDLTRKDEYLKTLKKEILLKYKGEPLQTLYFGGGTPSLLSINELKGIISLFTFNKSAEITLEINPETVDNNYLSELKGTGINRISIGAQTFDDNILKLIGRKHQSIDTYRVVKIAKNYGFDNISLDFIYGLPNQSIKSFETDLETAIDLGIEHISLYGLKIEENCYFYKNPPKSIGDEDLQADMYLRAIETLTKHHFEHYEISNFAQKDKYSKHNINYWLCEEYYGFGLAAHGYTNGIRYSNYNNLQDYINNYNFPKENHKLSEKERFEETVFLGLRLKKGINLKEINKNYNINFEEKYSKTLKKYIDTGHLLIDNDILKFSKNGILISNYILADFIE